VSTEKFLEGYPPDVYDLISLGREYLLRTVHGLQEELDLPSKILVYRVAPGMKGIVFTLVPSKKGARIGFYRGRELEDPARFMQGNGKVHSTIPLSKDIFTNPDFHTLIRLVAEKARSRVIIGR